jgi:glucokinase
VSTGNDLEPHRSALLLAGDIGGTKTELAIFSLENGARKPLAYAQFPSREFPTFDAVVREFLRTTDLPVRRGCIAVAGPVIAGTAKIVNLPWRVDAANLASAFRLESVALINDLQAVAIAVPALTADDLHPLNVGTPMAGGTIAVIAPGTGLGQAFLTWDGSRYRAYPSEGGHASFAPATEREAGLLAHLTQRFGHVSVERVCSGPGVANIYDYLRDSGQGVESAEMQASLAASKDRPPVIIEAALRAPNPDALSAAAVDHFVSILGAEAGNLALKLLATGGVYVAGGVPPRILPALEPGRFMQAFAAKGRLGELLAQIPVYVVLRHAALLGAATHGLELAASGGLDLTASAAEPR